MCIWWKYFCWFVMFITRGPTIKVKGLKHDFFFFSFPQKRKFYCCHIWSSPPESTSNHNIQDLTRNSGNRSERYRGWLNWRHGSNGRFISVSRPPSYLLTIRLGWQVGEPGHHMSRDEAHNLDIKQYSVDCVCQIKCFWLKTVHMSTN